MKRLAVLVKNEKVDSVISSLRELNLDAIIYDVKSAGKEREKTHSGRGTSATSSYLPRKIIATVVEDDNVQATSNAIKKSITGDSKGVIIVTSVDDFIPF